MRADNYDSGALMILRNTKNRLTQQQYKTLRGQVLAGDTDGAMKGLRNILRRRAGSMKKEQQNERHITDSHGRD